MKKLALHWQILIALLLALVVGIGLRLTFGDTVTESASGFLAVCTFIKKLFLQALKMIIVPIILPSIICGMIGLGGEKNFGRLGIKTLTYYFSSGLIAILTGLLLVNLIQPGNVAPEVAEKITAQAENPAEFLEAAAGRDGSDFAEIFLRMVPSNIFQAATDNGQLLGVIVFGILFGFFASRLPDGHRKTQQAFWESLLAVINKMADFIVRLSPYGVFAMVTPILATTGFGVFKPLLLFTLTVLLGLAIHAFITLPLILKFFGCSPRKHFRAISPAGLMAFSTASSSATLPVTMDAVQDRAGVSRRVSSFTLPLGATMNMDGTALYECVVVVFIAQFYAVTHAFDFGLMVQFQVVLLALLTSVGVAGIPRASLVAILVILNAVGLPIEYIGIIMVVDSVLDMFRTSVNVTSDTVGAAIIARSEGETGLYPDHPNVE